MNKQNVLNSYGEIAKHWDCLEFATTEKDCAGPMVWWENPVTGNMILRCDYHAMVANERQDKIHRDYLNDTVREDEI